MRRGPMRLRAARDLVPGPQAFCRSDSRSRDLRELARIDRRRWISTGAWKRGPARRGWVLGPGRFLFDYEGSLIRILNIVEENRSTKC